MVHRAKRRASQWPWPPPSPRVRDLIRRGAEMALRAPPEWLAEVDNATLDTDYMKAVADDPVLAAATRRSNRDNLLHWAAANARDPGAPVPANVGAEPIAIARELVRRGATQSSLDAYRTGQNAAWLRWMSLAFALTSDVDELRELLDVSARSIANFVDATIAAISAQMLVERDELTRGTHAERREVVALVLDGAPITTKSAAQRLGYDLDQTHHAAIVWSDAPSSDMTLLERAADAVADAIGSQRRLTVIASAATLWLWVPRGAEPDLDQLRVATRALAHVRIAIGSRGRGVEGFRRSHFDALSTQRMLARVGSAHRIASFAEVQLVALVTQDPEAAAQFVADTLGELATAPVELRDTVRTFLAEGCNASRAAEVLHTHRNTLLRRLARAEDLLPRGLDGNRIHVAVALDVLRWQRPEA
ncbi:MAG: PucR family transcriptional regulator [Deltaproteobacteria bacterium]|nr:PucR family transcriptional regulator [Deltaproteobacteria bacterium]